MRIAVYSLTRDRLWATKPCFASLRKNAGAPFFHVVVDNGSTDGTAEWLANEFRPDSVIALPENVGISRASNRALEKIFGTMPDVDMIVKMDNDCLVQSSGILTHLTALYGELMRPFSPRWVLSPHVDGIAKQPARLENFWTKNYEIGRVCIVGGLFHVVPASVYRNYRYPENLPLARGQDDDFCAWTQGQGCAIGYVENLSVAHYLTTAGQAQMDAEYFARKHNEERMVPA